MKQVLIACAIVAAATASSDALAQGYVGISAGQSNTDLDCIGTSSCDKTDTAFKLFGAYMFTPNLGVEGSYYNLGKARLAGTDPVLGTVTADHKGDGFGLYAIAAATPVEQVVLFAKLGVMSTNIKVEATSTVAGSTSNSERNTDVGWGLGADYNFTRFITGRLEFERVRVKFQDVKNNIDLVSVGVIYHF